MYFGSGAVHLECSYAKTVQKLEDTLPKRIKAVLKIKGDITYFLEMSINTEF